MGVFHVFLNCTNGTKLGNAPQLCEVLRFFLYLLISWSFRNHETTPIYQFINNNQTLSQLWGKENLLNHQNVSKYYEHDCSILYDYKVSSTNIRKNYNAIHRYYRTHIKGSLNKHESSLITRLTKTTMHIFRTFVGR